MSEAGEIRPRKQSPIARLSRSLKRFRKNPVAAFLIDLIVIVGAALVLSVLIKAFLIRSFYIPSGSMLDTLQINDRIIVNVMVPEVMEVQRGDIVVFRDPGGWLGAIPTSEKEPIQEVSDFILGTFGITAPDSAEHLVKRVIGLPGDVVECCDASMNPIFAPVQLPQTLSSASPFLRVTTGSWVTIGRTQQIPDITPTCQPVGLCRLRFWLVGRL